MGHGGAGRWGMAEPAWYGPVRPGRTGQARGVKEITSPACSPPDSCP